ncbi:MAG: long-chain fatty acid--CoA ligase [Candidatus Riflebacteria bacterium]|nr:long-chain fatty acid--CoA ligase [Candidatus Riflebacteria bacterium]
MLEKIWVSQYDKNVNCELCGTPIPLGNMILEAAANFGDCESIKEGKEVITYNDLNNLTGLIAGNLKNLGLSKQDRVGVLLPNLKETIIAFWSIVRGGFVGVMTNPLYTESELIYQYNDSGIKTLITAEPFLPKIKAILDKTNIQNVFVVSNNFIENEDKRIKPWKSLLKETSSYICENINIENDLALLQYTGGTTGISKGCMLTHKNLWSNAKQVSQMFEVILEPGRERFIGVLPYFHIYGLQVSVIIPVMLSACMLPIPQFSPRGLLKLIQEEKATCMPSAPAIFNACTSQKDIDSYDLSTLKFIISGSAPLHVAQMIEFESKTGAKISEGYGLSEASPVTHFTSVLGKHIPGSIGLPIPGTEVKIVDIETGTVELKNGEEGELCIRGPQVMKGYFNRPDQTNEVLRNGWLHTGDIARCDKEGFFYITDRKKDLILTGGYNVYPREVEEVLLNHSKVKEAVVIGVANKTRGESVKAFIVLKEGEALEKSTELIEFCRKHMANYKVPKEIEIRNELPKSSVGKVLRRLLREEKIAA